MGMKEGINALTKTTRVFGAIVGAFGVAAAIFGTDVGFVLLYTIPITIVCFVGSWILDSFVQ